MIMALFCSSHLSAFYLAPPDAVIEPQVRMGACSRAPPHQPLIPGSGLHVLVSHPLRAMLASPRWASSFAQTGTWLNEKLPPFKAAIHSNKHSHFKQIGFPFSRCSVSVVCCPAQLIKDRQLCSLISSTKQLVSHYLLTPQDPVQTQKT